MNLFILFTYCQHPCWIISPKIVGNWRPNCDLQNFVKVSSIFKYIIQKYFKVCWNFLLSFFSCISWMCQYQSMISTTRYFKSFPWIIEIPLYEFWDMLIIIVSMAKCMICTHTPRIHWSWKQNKNLIIADKNLEKQKMFVTVWIYENYFTNKTN